MKKLFIFWKLLVLPLMAFCQNLAYDSSHLFPDGKLYDYYHDNRKQVFSFFRGQYVAPSTGGSSQQTLEYFPQSQSYWSIASGTAANKNAGFYNIVIGNGAGDSCEACYYNFLAGKGAGKRLRVGFDNTAIGFDAMREAISANNLVAIGDDALRDNNSRDNVAISRGTLTRNVSGKENNAIGLNAMANNLLGNENTAYGAYALNFMGVGYSNTAIGTYAMELNELEDDLNTVIRESTAIGYMAGFNSHYSNFVCIGAKTNVTANGDININNKIRWRNNSFEIAGSNVTIGGYTYHVTNTPPAGVQSQLIADGNGNVTWTPLGQSVRVNVQVEKPKKYMGWLPNGTPFLIGEIK